MVIFVRAETKNISSKRHPSNIVREFIICAMVNAIKHSNSVIFKSCPHTENPNLGLSLSCHAEITFVAKGPPVPENHPIWFFLMSALLGFHYERIMTDSYLFIYRGFLLLNMILKKVILMYHWKKHVSRILIPTCPKFLYYT